MSDWPAIADELAYALQVHAFCGRGEFAEYTTAEADQFALSALERYREAEELDGEA